jgi:hypothetical protein
MHNHYKLLMKLLITLISFIFAIIIIYKLSWDLYILVHSRYFWGLILPIRSFSTALIIVITITLLLSIIFYLIVKKLRNRC